MAGAKRGSRRSSSEAAVAAASGGGSAAAVAAALDVQGKRSKVQIASETSIPLGQDGFEDEDAMFAAAKSPPVSAAENNNNNDKETQEKAKVEKQLAMPKKTKQLRFSLGQQQDQGGGGGGDTDELSSVGRPSRMAQQIKSSLSRESMSPSELSLVSAAPPLANVSNEDDDDDDNDDANDDHDMSNTPVRGKDDMEEEEEKQATPMDATPSGSDDSQPNASAVKETPRAAQEEEDDEEDGFPVQVDDNDEDESHGNLEEEQDDDLIPPPPPDSPERDNEPLDEEEVDGPTQDGALSNEEEESPGVPKDDESQNDNDQDMEGSGFEMADAKTPASSMRKGRFSRHGEESTVTRKRHSEKEPEETQKKKKKRKNDEDKKKKKKRKKGAVSAEEQSDEDDSTAVPKKKKKKTTSRFATRFSPKGIPLAQEYETIPLSDLKPDDGTPPVGLRRSGRTRVAPLAFWKNEKPEYGANDDDEAPSDLINMPIVKAYIRALDTPYKPRRVPPPAAQQRGKQKGKTATTATSSSNRHAAAPSEPFDSSRLRAKLGVIDGEEGRLWDDNIEEAADMKIVAYKSRMEARKLPLVKNRTKAEGKVVGKAAQAFNVPNGAKVGYAGYIMGNLTLPPKGIKDAESVGSCSQTFTVVTGQPGALEIAYADPDEDENGNLSPETALRYLLGPGDMFRVPPGNCYRLQNHSKTENCFLTWTIIRPVTLDHHHQGGGSPTSSPATSMGGQSSK